MKLSELSYREYIALEALPAIVGRREAPSKLQVSHAFDIADAFLHSVGKTDERLAHAEARALRAEGKFATLQAIHVNMGEDFSARIALTQIWEFLGVANQTAAMQKLNDLLHGGVMPS